VLKNPHRRSAKVNGNIKRTFKMKNSNRLILCKPVKADFERFYEIHSDPETNIFNPNGAMNFEMAEKAFTKMTDHWKENGFGTWSIREKENSEFIIGFGGLDYRLYGNETKLNLGYRFDKGYWGKGYATELAQNAIEFGFNELHLKEIFAIVRPKHLVSIKVLEKCSMRLVDELNDVPNGENSLIYKIEK
jgi:[ribosomal protein S5]-alanine N-acetyltransferase